MNDRELLKDNIDEIFEYYKNLEKTIHRFNNYLSKVNINEVIVDKHSFKDFDKSININTSKINDKLIYINYNTEHIRQTLEILDRESEDNL